MGAINFTIDTDLIDFLKTKLPLANFVETGTYKGESLEKVIGKFDKLFSCEINKSLYENSRLKFKDNDKVEIYNQSSPDFIRTIKKENKIGSALYWLDAHFTATSDDDKDLSQCPVLQELEAIESINEDSVIIIDDARYFLSPPPPPNDFKNWPEFTDIVNKLNQLNNNYRYVVFNDVLIFFPNKIKNELFTFLSTRTFDILKVMDRAKEYPILIAQNKSKEIEINELKAECLIKDKDILEKNREIHEKEEEIFKLKETNQEMTLQMNNQRDENKMLLETCQIRDNELTMKEAKIHEVQGIAQNLLKQVDTLSKLQNESLIIKFKNSIFGKHI
ncbi:MAG: hypothetical protein U0T83_04215 [Bacteriovoracaceae bacterium]